MTHKYLLLLLLTTITSTAIAQKVPGKFELNLELEHRKGKTYTEEKYYKNGKLDSIYRKWDTEGRKVTEGYYIAGKRHGTWMEWMSIYQRHDYMRYTYAYDTIKSLYDYTGWANEKGDSIKSQENFYIFEPGNNNYQIHEINWDEKLGKGIKGEELIMTVRNNVFIEKKIKRWDKGMPWEEEHTKTLYDKNGKSLGHKKHGTWRLWNEDGTLQKETWYDMGKMLHEKLYDHGKLVSDKRY